MKKKGSLSKRKNTFEKKKSLSGFYRVSQVSGWPDGLTNLLRANCRAGFWMKQTWLTLLSSAGSRALHNWVLLGAGANCIRSCWTTGPTTIESCWVVEPKAIRSCWAAEPNRIGSGWTTRIKDVRFGFRSQTQLAPLKEPMQFDLATNCRSRFWMK
jgi:hypothetical protein